MSLTTSLQTQDHCGTPHILHSEGVLSRMQLASTIRPLKKFLLGTQTIMTLPRFMFTVKTIASTVCDHAVVFLHQREELPLQHEGHNIHDDFAVAILKNNCRACTTGHFLVFPAEEWQQHDLYRRRER